MTAPLRPVRLPGISCSSTVVCNLSLIMRALGRTRNLDGMTLVHGSHDDYCTITGLTIAGYYFHVCSQATVLHGTGRTTTVACLKGASHMAGKDPEAVTVGFFPDSACFMFGFPRSVAPCNTTNPAHCTGSSVNKYGGGSQPPLRSLTPFSPSLCTFFLSENAR